MTATNDMMMSGCLEMKTELVDKIFEKRLWLQEFVKLKVSLFKVENS